MMKVIKIKTDFTYDKRLGINEMKTFCDKMKQTFKGKDIVEIETLTGAWTCCKCNAINIITLPDRIADEIEFYCHFCQHIKSIDLSGNYRRIYSLTDFFQNLDWYGVKTGFKEKI